MTQPFNGAKAATFIGDKLLLILRDDIAGIDFPGHWDFPGGGREGAESGVETLAREMMEEVGLSLAEAEITWSGLLPSHHAPGQESWFFVVRFPHGTDARIRFGDEGQRWELATLEDALNRQGMVPSLVQRLKLSLGVAD